MNKNNFTKEEFLLEIKMSLDIEDYPIAVLSIPDDRRNIFDGIYIEIINDKHGKYIGEFGDMIISEHTGKVLIKKTIYDRNHKVIKEPKYLPLRNTFNRLSDYGYWDFYQFKRKRKKLII